MLNVVSNEQLEVEEQEAAIAEEEATNYSAETLDGIAGHINNTGRTALT